MIRIGTLEDSRSNRRHLRTASGAGYFKSDFILPPAPESLEPQAFLVEQEPDSLIRAHFHKQNQFQVVVDGSADIGRHAVAPVSLHYANRHTGYGPIQSGPQGVSYFSLRDRATADAYYLPESRGLMEDVPRRNVFADRIALSTPQALGALAQVQVQPVIAPEADGPAAWTACLPPGSRTAIAQVRGGADRFHLVLCGSLVHGGARLPRLATLFTSAHEPPLELVAGQDGAQVLVMQFPVQVR